MTSTMPVNGKRACATTTTTTTSPPRRAVDRCAKTIKSREDGVVLLLMLLLLFVVVDNRGDLSRVFIEFTDLSRPFEFQNVFITARRKPTNRVTACARFVFRFRYFRATKRKRGRAIVSFRRGPRNDRLTGTADRATPFW